MTGYLPDIMGTSELTFTIGNGNVGDPNYNPLTITLSNENGTLAIRDAANVNLVGLKAATWQIIPNSGAGVLTINDSVPTVTLQLSQSSTIAMLTTNNGPLELDAGSGGVLNSHQIYLLGTSNFVGFNTNNPLCLIDAAGTIRTTNVAAPATGLGTELNFNPGTSIGSLLAFSRTGGVYLELDIDGLPLELNKHSNGAIDTGTGDMTINSTHLNVNAGSLIFFSTGPAVGQQVAGKTLTNNVTSGGTDFQLDDFTSLSVYATDAAAIHHDIYQLGHVVKTILDGLRSYKLLT